MKIYRTASKSMIKTNGVQKVFFCLRIDSKYMNIVIDQRGKECLEVREKLAYDYNSTYNLLLLTKSYAPIFLFSYYLITLGVIIKKIFTENTKYSRKVTIGVWRSFLTSLLSLFFLSKPGVSLVGTTTSPYNRIHKLALTKTHVRYSWRLKL